MVMYETILDPAKKLLRCAFNVDVLDAKDARVQARNAICDECPHLRKRGGVRQCGQCKCILNCKTRVPSEECPIGKWKAVDATISVTRKEISQEAV